jgi:tetratricopeptide (TPR) repeat protein
MTARWRVARERAASILVLLAAVPVLCAFDLFRSENSAVREGNAQLAAGKPKEALEAYNRAAKALPEEKGVDYNRGIALYRLGKYEEARKALLDATGAQDRSLRQQAFYNLGNALYQTKAYRDAADAYRRALRIDPADRAAKWNLELALRQIREEEKKKKQQQDKDKDKQKQQDKQQRQGSPEQEQMRRALDALNRGDKDLQKRRLRLLYGGQRRPTKDW